MSAPAVQKCSGLKTMDSAVSIYERQFRRPCNASWNYTDEQGNVVSLVLRWNEPNGKKEIRPVSLIDGRWYPKGMPDPRPLYNLPKLAGAKRVYVTEGEKAAAMANEIGLIATTSANGAGSAAKTDWSPLAGKVVVFLPDNDPAGMKYVDEVIAILAKLQNPPLVKVVRLPDLPPKGDIVDYVTKQRPIERAKFERGAAERIAKSEAELKRLRAEIGVTEDKRDLSVLHECEERITSELKRLKEGQTPQESPRLPSSSQMSSCPQIPWSSQSAEIEAAGSGVWAVFIRRPFQALPRPIDRGSRRRSLSFRHAAKCWAPSPAHRGSSCCHCCVP